MSAHPPGPLRPLPGETPNRIGGRFTGEKPLGLVTVEGHVYAIVDIGMRMLEPDELLRAQFGRFADAYDLSPAKTKAAKVRLIGNSVPPEMSYALARANVAPADEREEEVA